MAIPKDIAQTLAGKRIGLIAFEQPDVIRISRAFDQSQAFTRVLEGFDSTLPDGELFAQCDLIVLNARREGGSCPKTEVLDGLANRLLVVSAPDLLLANIPAARDFLVEPWSTEEIVLRAYRIFLMIKKETVVLSGWGAATRVVVADDDPTIGALVRAILQRHGIDCDVAQDGGQALELIRQLKPQVAILDVDMPHLDGFQVLSAIKNDPSSAGTRVVMLTGREQEEDVVRGFGLGAEDYIVKPFNPMELMARLKRLIPVKM